MACSVTLQEAYNRVEIVRLLPVFLISQKSKIFDSFPSGEAFGNPSRIKENPYARCIDKSEICLRGY